MRGRGSTGAAIIALGLVTAACTSSVVAPSKVASSASTSSAAALAPARTSSVVPVTPKSAAPSSPRTKARSSSASAHPSPATTSDKPKTPAKTRTTQKLPLDSSTGNAKQVVTVTAPSTSSTTATLQAWTKAGSGWRQTGPSVLAHLGSDGMSADASESKSATPIGSFTLTRAFGHDSNPGTTLPYVHTTPSDWWISQPGQLYNTFQACASNCSFTQGDPNEHLYYETPFYDYAVVIDYNTANAPGGVQPGKGSAFFLHVTDGSPTAGCVSIPMQQLVRIMRWLIPAKHPRIMIGIG